MWHEKVFLLIGCVLHTHSALGLWTCTQDSHCSSLSGSVCLDGGCACPPGQESVLGGTLCVNLATYHASTCVESHQCSRLFTSFECRKTDTESTEGICSCQPGFHYFLGRCWPTAGYGQACSRDEECMSVIRDPYSLRCNETCECAEGYYTRQRGECRRIANAIGEGCILDEDCQFENGVCDLESRACYDVNIGPPTLEHSEEVAESRASAYERQSWTACSTDLPCPEPFICLSGSCVCPVGYYSRPNGTLCYAELGSPTASADLCVGLLAVVIDGVCTCPNNFFFDENMRDCIRVTRRISDSCVTDSNCFTFGASSRCGEPQLPWGVRTCECIPEQAVWDARRQMCRLFAGIGESCEVDSDCLAGELEIRCVHNELGEGVCECPDGLQAIDGLCLTTGLGLGDECQASRECTETANTICEDGRCSCEPGYIEDEGACAAAIGGSCVEDTDCIIEHTVCVASNNQSTCQCSQQFVQSADSCFPVATGLESVCTVTEQCTASLGEFALCRNSSCVCADLFHYRDGGCWQRTGLFETCSRTSECFLSGLSDRVVCRNSLCQCDFSYPYVEQLNTCTSSAASIAGNGIVWISALYYLLSIK